MTNLPKHAPFGEGITIVGTAAFNVAALKAMAATTDYTQYDVMSEDASAGTVWTFTMPGGFPNGGSGEIIGALLYAKNTQATHLTRFKFYNVSALNCNLNDNAADTSPHVTDMYSGTTPLTGYQGKIDFGALTQKGSGGTEAQIAPGDGDVPLAFSLADGDNKLYAVSVDMSGETAELAAGEYICILKIRQD